MCRPREPSLLYPKKTKNPNPSPIGNRFGFFLFGGRGWIRTTEAESSRFTVCPHWPLGNTPIFIFVRPFAGRLAYFSMGNGFCQLFFTFFFKGFFAPVEGGVRQCGWLCAKTADIRLFCRKKYLPDKRQIRRLRIAFCAILCYNFGRTEQKTAGAFCRFARWEG